MTTTVQDKLSQEILRKLRLATAVDTKEDRNIICSEVFNDITGSVDRDARAVLGLDTSISYYQVLAPYYLKKWDVAESLVYTCRRLWSQPYIVPVFTLLLHQWLLQECHTEVPEHKKYMNVLVTGTKALFHLDSDQGTVRFQALYHDLMQAITSRPLDDSAALTGLPRQALVKLTAAYTPYYANQQNVKQLLLSLPSLQSVEPAAKHSMEDYVVTEISGMLRTLQSEQGLLRYLNSLEPLFLNLSAWKGSLMTVTLLRLQSALYSLTVPGGPRYYPVAVRTKALRALNGAFPTGSHSRGIVRLIFRFFHPSDWPMLIWLWLRSWGMFFYSGLSRGAALVCTVAQAVLSCLPFTSMLRPS